MSTRANIHFKNGDRLVANIYRHRDGFPDGLGVDLHVFLDQTAGLKDRRWSDAEYLAAKFLVWQAAEYATSRASNQENRELNPLEFLSVAPASRTMATSTTATSSNAANPGDGHRCLWRRRHVTVTNRPTRDRRR